LPVAVRAYKLLIPKLVIVIDFHLLRKVAKIKDSHKHKKKYFHFGQKLVTALLQLSLIRNLEQHFSLLKK